MRTLPVARARHAKPAATRTAVRTGLTAALLPLAWRIPPRRRRRGRGDRGPATAIGRPRRPDHHRPPRPCTHSACTSCGGRSLAGAPVRFERCDAARLASAPASCAPTPRLRHRRPAASASTDAPPRRRAVTRRSAARCWSASTAPAASRARAAVAPRRAASPVGGFRAAALRVALRAGRQARTATAPPARAASTAPAWSTTPSARSAARCRAPAASCAPGRSRSAAPNAQPGDLVFSPGHVGIYVRPGVMVDAPNSGSRVSVRSIYARNYTIGRVR